MKFFASNFFFVLVNNHFVLLNCYFILDKKDEWQYLYGLSGDFMRRQTSNEGAVLKSGDYLFQYSANQQLIRYNNPGGSSETEP